MASTEMVYDPNECNNDLIVLCRYKFCSCLLNPLRIFLYLATNSYCLKFFSRFSQSQNDLPQIDYDPYEALHLSNVTELQYIIFPPLQYFNKPSTTFISFNMI